MAEERMLYRPAEAAVSLGLSRTRIYQLMTAGELGSVKVGSSRRIPAAELEAFVQRLRSQNAGFSSRVARRAGDHAVA